MKRLLKYLFVLGISILSACCSCVIHDPADGGARSYYLEKAAAADIGADLYITNFCSSCAIFKDVLDYYVLPMVVRTNDFNYHENGYQINYYCYYTKIGPLFDLSGDVGLRLLMNGDVIRVLSVSPTNDDIEALYDVFRILTNGGKEFNVYSAKLGLPGEYVNEEYIYTYYLPSAIRTYTLAPMRNESYGAYWQGLTSAQSNLLIQMTNLVPRHTITLTTVSNPIALVDYETGTTNVGDYDYYVRIVVYYTNALSNEIRVSQVHDTNLNWFWCGTYSVNGFDTMNEPSASITNVLLTNDNGTNTAVYLIHDYAAGIGSTAYPGTTNDVFGAVVFRSTLNSKVNRAIVLGR